MSIKSMEVEELKNLIDKKENIVLIDCREEHEWNDGHIEGAILMPLSRFQEDFKKLENKNAKIIMQCRSGRRSLDACYFLAENGFTDLTNLDGGILAWADSEYPIKK